MSFNPNVTPNVANLYPAKTFCRPFPGGLEVVAKELFAFPDSVQMQGVRVIRLQGQYHPLDFVGRYLPPLSDEVRRAITVCRDAPDFLASTPELDAAVETVKDFGMCTVFQDSVRPRDTYLSRAEGHGAKWDVVAEGEMLFLVKNNDRSRPFCVRVYISQGEAGTYNVHLFLRSVHTLLAASDDEVLSFSTKQAAKMTSQWTAAEVVSRLCCAKLSSRLASSNPNQVQQRLQDAEADLTKNVAQEAKRNFLQELENRAQALRVKVEQSRKRARDGEGQAAGKGKQPRLALALEEAGPVKEESERED